MIVRRKVSLVFFLKDCHNKVPDGTATDRLADV